MTRQFVADMALDHPSWLVSADDAAIRVVRSGRSIWGVTCSPRSADGRCVRMQRFSGVGDPPVLDVFDPATLTSNDPAAEVLRADGPMARLRNPDLWDALATSILRQVIRADQARKLYRSFCRDCGEHVATSAGTACLFPSPETVLALPEEEFARLGLAFKLRPLRSAADAYLKSRKKWEEFNPERLLIELQLLHRIGPWTAGATVADVTNDYALYPFADLAVRTWARRLVPERRWPKTEEEFRRAWRELAGEQLSEWTLLTIAWGSRNSH